MMHDFVRRAERNYNMSFEIVCEGCGAISGPSVGVCPFCKTVLAKTKNAITGHNELTEAYQKGNMELALCIAKKLHTENKKATKDVSFLLLYAKILLETEGPSSQINALLTEALLLEPENNEVRDYMDIIQAKGSFKKGVNDAGENALKLVLKRSPENVHALFLLGSHLYWVESAAPAAAHYLERCVKVAPNFLRAWGCLSAVYKGMNNIQLSQRSLQKCIEIETNPSMKEYFFTELKKLAL